MSLERDGVRVLCVIDSLAPGGAETSLVAMAPLLVGSGVDLHVAYLHEREGLRRNLAEIGVPTYSIDFGDVRLRLRRLRVLIRNLTPDLVHTTLAESDLLGRLASRLEGVPVVSSLVNVQYGPEQLRDPHVKRWKLRLWQLLDIVTARGVRRFHAVGRDVSKVMSRRLLVRRDLIDIVPRGRDPQLLGEPSPERRRSVRESLRVGSREIVLAVGRHAHQKAFDVLLESFVDVASARSAAYLWIAGKDGPETNSLRDQIGRLGLQSRVQLLGHRDDIADLLNACDVFALPSRREGSPGALIEAMAMGVPCIASDIGSVREVVGSPPVGWLVPPESPWSLSMGIQQLLADPSLAQELGARARKRFLDQYTLRKSAEGIVTFYLRGLGARRSFAS